MYKPDANGRCFSCFPYKDVFAITPIVLTLWLCLSSLFASILLVNFTFLALMAGMLGFLAWLLILSSCCLRMNQAGFLVVAFLSLAVGVATFVLRARILEDTFDFETICDDKDNNGQRHRRLVQWNYHEFDEVEEGHDGRYLESSCEDRQETFSSVFLIAATLWLVSSIFLFLFAFWRLPQIEKWMPQEEIQQEPFDDHEQHRFVEEIANASASAATTVTSSPLHTEPDVERGIPGIEQIIGMPPAAPVTEYEVSTPERKRRSTIYAFPPYRSSNNTESPAHVRRSEQDNHNNDDDNESKTTSSTSTSSAAEPAWSPPVFATGRGMFREERSASKKMHRKRVKKPINYNKNITNSRNVYQPPPLPRVDEEVSGGAGDVNIVGNEVESDEILAVINAFPSQEPVSSLSLNESQFGQPQIEERILAVIGIDHSHDMDPVSDLTMAESHSRLSPETIGVVHANPLSNPKTDLTMTESLFQPSQETIRVIHADENSDLVSSVTMSESDFVLRKQQQEQAALDEIPPLESVTEEEIRAAVRASLKKKQNSLRRKVRHPEEETTGGSLPVARKSRSTSASTGERVQKSASARRPKETVPPAKPEVSDSDREKARRKSKKKKKRETDKQVVGNLLAPEYQAVSALTLNDAAFQSSKKKKSKVPHVSEESVIGSLQASFHDVSVLTLNEAEFDEKLARKKKKKKAKKEAASRAAAAAAAAATSGEDSEAVATDRDEIGNDVVKKEKKKGKKKKHKKSETGDETAEESEAVTDREEKTKEVKKKKKKHKSKRFDGDAGDDSEAPTTTTELDDEDKPDEETKNKDKAKRKTKTGDGTVRVLDTIVDTKSHKKKKKKKSSRQGRDKKSSSVHEKEEGTMADDGINLVGIFLDSEQSESEVTDYTEEESSSSNRYNSVLQADLSASEHNRVAVAAAVSKSSKLRDLYHHRTKADDEGGESSIAAKTTSSSVKAK